jgi:two-component system phosphate regulon sensor histidine kinase PhoR
MKKTDENQSETIGFIAHEIKTPITALSGFLDLIQNVGELNTLQQNYLSRAFETLDWMQNIIDNIRQWSNLNHTVSIHPSTIELYSLFDGCINLLQPLASRRNIEITLTIRDNLRQIQADEELLKHVIINLLSNAIKYNVQDGTIDISISHNITHILFAIKDSGIGIAEQDQQKVFEQFYRASSGKRIEGTGLGLTISRKIIEAHGGKIWLESKLSEGTTSYFTLPIIQAYAHDSERAFYQAGEVIDDVHDDMQERQEISIEREGDEH